jgi:hypothetical protein
MLMKKGLLSLLVAAITLVGVQASFAVAPTLKNIPDVCIGDEEDNGVSDNNFFRFTDAFRFDDYVLATDPSTTASALLWSFDEVNLAGDPQWYTINGKDPIHTTLAQQGTGDPADHISPGASNELRQGNEYATFRDIVFSPTPDNLPYPTPSADHSAGKVVTFFVSDGSQVASQEIIVKTVDNTFDALTGGSPYDPYYDETFDTQHAGWLTGGATVALPGSNTLTYNGTTGAYTITVFTNGTGTYKFAYWYGDRPFWLPYSEVGTDKYVRAKYYMYATGQTGGTANIPNFNLKLQNRFAVTTQLLVQTHDETSPGDLTAYQELRPSTDPNNPSLYRVDFDPIDVPFLSTNTNVSGQGEGIQPSFEAFVLFSTDNGTIGMTELEMGTYPISALGTPVASQVRTAAQVGENPTASVDTRYNVVIGAAAGVKPTTENTNLGSIGGSGAGTAFDSTPVPTDRIGYLDRLFSAGATTERMRIAPNELYRIRYHITSNRPTSTQGWIWLQTRAARFGWNVYLQLAGGGQTGTSRGIAREALPGTGSLNPDELNPGENGGWYTVLMNTPLDTDIAPDRGDNTIAGDFPTINAAPDRGDPATSTYGDIRVHAQVYDSLSQLGLAETNAEASVFLVDRIEIDAYTQIQDGDN